jgi:hypothetical protein
MIGGLVALAKYDAVIRVGQLRSQEALWLGRSAFHQDCSIARWWHVRVRAMLRVTNS